MKNTKRWTPVREGRYYCSPACGEKCLHKDYRTAKEESAAAAKLLGPRWKPRVWENLGWHWEVTQGNVKIYKSTSDREKDKYHCIINFDSPNFSATFFGSDLRAVALEASTYLIEVGTSIINNGHALFLGTKLANYSKKTTHA